MWLLDESLCDGELTSNWQASSSDAPVWAVSAVLATEAPRVRLLGETVTVGAPLTAAPTPTGPPGAPPVTTALLSEASTVARCSGDCVSSLTQSLDERDRGGAAAGPSV